MRSRRRNKYDVIIREKLWKAFVGIISKCYVNIKSNNYIYSSGKRKKYLQKLRACQIQQFKRYSISMKHLKISTAVLFNSPRSFGI